ncbi:MAG: hypothetical protein ACREDJ_02235 [Methylocella sp.]
MDGVLAAPPRPESPVEAVPARVIGEAEIAAAARPRGVARWLVSAAASVVADTSDCNITAENTSVMRGLLDNKVLPSVRDHYTCLTPLRICP